MSTSDMVHGKHFARNEATRHSLLGTRKSHGIILSVEGSHTHLAGDGTPETQAS